MTNGMMEHSPALLAHVSRTSSPFVHYTFQTQQQQTSINNVPSCSSFLASTYHHSSLLIPQPLTPLQDLGKSSSDLLFKDYPIQGTSLEVKTLTPSNVAFKVAGTKDAKTDAISGDIEGKYVDFKNGLTFTQVRGMFYLLYSKEEKRAS